MRVLFTSTPGRGHVHPLVPVAMALQRAGHDVTWATGPSACEQLDRLGLANRSAGIDSADRQAEFRRRCPQIPTTPPREIRALAYPTMFGAIAAPLMFADLAPIVDEVRPDVIVHEPCELAAAPTAVGRGIPYVGVGFGALIPDALLTSAAREVTEMWASVGATVPAACGLYDHLYLHPFPPSLTTSTDTAERAGDRVRGVRPLAYDGRLHDEAPPWTAALGTERPCIYVTFGTELGAQAPFGPVLEAVDGLDADVVVTTGPRVDPEALGPVAANVRVEAYVPQRFVLSRSALAVSHAGSGAVLGAAELGLPQLCLPRLADQFTNADALAAAGVAVVIEPHEVDADRVRDAIEAMLGDADVGPRAAVVQAEIAALPAPDDFVAEISALV